MCVYGRSLKMQGESRGLAILLSKQDGVGHRKKDKWLRHYLGQKKNKTATGKTIEILLCSLIRAFTTYT